MTNDEDNATDGKVAVPLRVENPLWERRVRSQLWDEPYNVEADPKIEPPPRWSFDRYGQSVTELPDGRIFYVGGEHEDFYMPDFKIYNDLVVVHPDRRVEFYLYPPNVFPPTDFHTATRIGDKIYLIGSLGYDGSRYENVTPVYCLDTTSLEIKRVETYGNAPGWIHGHQAEVKESGAIHIAKGACSRAAHVGSVENINEWLFHPATGQWTQLTDHRWNCWRFRRSDDGCNNLWMIRHAWQESLRESAPEDRQWTQDCLLRDMGFFPDVSMVPDLYNPPVAHERLERAEEKALRCRGIRIDGVLARYEETSGSVTLTIEGDLPEPIQQALVNDLREKLSALERHPWKAETVDLSGSRR